MNPFKALGRGAKKVVTAPVKFAKDTTELLTIRSRGAAWLDVAKEAQANPALYRDRQWWTRMLTATGRLLVVLPIPKEMQLVIEKLLGPNWRTTLAGMIGGFVVFMIDAMQGGMSLKGAAMGAAIAVLGQLSKDSSVTGGKKAATPEAATRVE